MNDPIAQIRDELDTLRKRVEKLEYERTVDYAQTTLVLVYCRGIAEKLGVHVYDPEHQTSKGSRMEPGGPPDG